MMALKVRTQRKPGGFILPDPWNVMISRNPPVIMEV